MSVSTTINSTLGVVSVIDPSSDTTPGTVTIAGLMAPVTALTEGSTLTPTQAGVVTITGSAIQTIVMPLASSCAGAVFTVRSLSNHAHALTGSQESGGTKVFALLASGSLPGAGSKLALTVNGSAGDATGGGPSVSLLSDGKNFLVLGASGSVALSGT